MKSKNNNSLLQAKKSIGSGIIITGIYAITGVAYNLMPQSSLVHTSFILKTMDDIMRDPAILIYGGTIPAMMLCSDMMKYKGLKKELKK